MGTAFREPTGVVVDTHVTRITRLLGLTRNLQPEKIEQDLMALLPPKEWINFSHRLIHHGRRICIARRPKCLECPLLPDCERVGLPPLDAPEAAVSKNSTKTKTANRSAKTSGPDHKTAEIVLHGNGVATLGVTE
jgi:endonuclease-3